MSDGIFASYASRKGKDSYIEPLFGEIPRRGREDRAVEEKKVFVQAAVRVAAVVAVILLIEFGNVTHNLIWLVVLVLIPIELILLLTSFRVLALLKTGLQKWIIDPFMKWTGREA